MHRSHHVLLTCVLLLTNLAACGGGGGGAAPAAPDPEPALPAGWVRLADLPAGVAKFGAAAVGGKLYVAGGYDTRRTLYIYDIAANRWDAGPNLPQGTDNVSVLEGGGKVYALGGEASSAVQVFDPATSNWTAGPALPAPRFATAAATLPGQLHLVGGWNLSNAASASVTRHDRLDLALQTWHSAAPLPTARNAAGGTALSGKLVVAGGRSPGIRANDQQALGTVEQYDPGTNTWSSLSPLPTPRGSLAVVALAGRVYALGGESVAAGVSNAVERYDPATNAWTALTAMPYRSHGLGAVAVGDAIYVMGGFTGASDAVGTESRALYRYTP